jgi:hypothetical protein
MEDGKLQELYDSFFNLTLEEITRGANPNAVAGVMVAIASRMYRTSMNDEDFQRMMEAISDSADKIQPYEFDNSLLH